MVEEEGREEEEGEREGSKERESARRLGISVEISPFLSSFPLGDESSKDVTPSCSIPLCLQE